MSWQKCSSDAEIQPFKEKLKWKVFIQNKFKKSYRIYLSAIRMRAFDRNLQGYFKRGELLKAILAGSVIIDTLEADRFLKFFITELYE